MKLSEIEDIDKSTLILKDIRYDFTDHINIISYAFGIVGNSTHRKNLLREDIDIYLREIDIFLNQDFPDSDDDVIKATNIYSKLLDVRNKL